MMSQASRKSHHAVASGPGSPCAGAAQEEQPRLASAERRRIEWALAQVHGPRVLEVGCAEGRLALMLARRGHDVVAVEASAGAIARARAMLAEEPPQVRERVRLHAGDPSTLDGSARGFDTVLLSDVLISHAHPEILLRETLARLRPGGRLITTLPFGFARHEERLHTFGLSALTDLLRPLCAPEHLSVERGITRFVGRYETPGNQSWAHFGPETLLKLSEHEIIATQIKLSRELDWCQNELDEVRLGLVHQVGSLLVEAAIDPRRLIALPGRLLSLYLSSRRAARSDQSRAGSARQLVDFPPFPEPRPQPPAGLTIAAILDGFSEACFRHEAELVLVTRKAWKEEIERAKPAFFFAESAWRGNRGEWSHLMTRFQERSQNPLAELLAHCRARGIPTVFWNKEDPPNFNEFIGLATQFDVVFTTDAHCIPHYQELCGHDRVYALPFAAQPMIHNPWRMAGLPLYSVCFAGSWYGGKYPHRREGLRQLLDPALRNDLHIFDRNQARGSERYRFPEEYLSAIKGSLPYDKMLTAYRCYRVLLNTNSVTDSPTMFSRRVFESLACGTPVVSTGSAGMKRMLGDLVLVTRSHEDTARFLDGLLGDEEARLRLAHLGYRQVHTNHTYRQRLDEMLGRIGLPRAVALRDPEISVITATQRPEAVERCLDNFARQTYPRREWILALYNGRFDVETIRDRLKSSPNVRVLHQGDRSTFGDALNAAVAVAGGDYVARMDDDATYGEHYLSDSLLAARYAQAELIGKSVYFVFLGHSKQMGLCARGREHDYVEAVSGASLFARRDLFRQLRFPAAERESNAAFQRVCTANGLRIYSADRYNLLEEWGTGPLGDGPDPVPVELAQSCRDLKDGRDLSRVMI